MDGFMATSERIGSQTGPRNSQAREPGKLFGLRKPFSLGETQLSSKNVLDHDFLHILFKCWRLYSACRTTFPPSWRRRFSAL